MAHNPKIKEHLISQEIIAFIIDRQARGLSDRTIEFYQSGLDHFNHYLQGIEISTIESIIPFHIRSYLIQLQDHRNRGGIHASYRSIRAFFNWWSVECDDPAWPNPIRKISLPEPSKEPLPGIPNQHINALLATCSTRNLLDSRDKAMIIFLLDTGLRRNEFLSLNYGDIDLKTGSVQVRHGKGNKMRTVFLGVRARRELIRFLRHRGQLADDDPLWITRSGTRLKPAGLRMVIHRRSLKANIPEPQIHDFRRSYALESLRNNIDLVSLMHLMGHSSTVVLQRYLKLIESDLYEAHQRSSPADNLK